MTRIEMLALVLNNIYELYGSDAVIKSLQHFTNDEALDAVLLAFHSNHGVVHRVIHEFKQE